MGQVSMGQWVLGTSFEVPLNLVPLWCKRLSERVDVVFINTSSEVTNLGKLFPFPEMSREIINNLKGKELRSHLFFYVISVCQTLTNKRREVPLKDH